MVNSRERLEEAVPIQGLWLEGTPCWQPSSPQSLKAGAVGKKPPEITRHALTALGSETPRAQPATPPLTGKRQEGSHSPGKASPGTS